MNKDKSIKDLKKYNDKLKNQIMLLETRNYSLQYRLEEKDKEIERLTAESTEWESKCYKYQDIINEVKDYVNFLILFNQTINGKFSETVWGREILDLLEENIELVELKEGKE